MSYMNILMGKGKPRPLDNDKEPKVVKSEEEPVEVCQGCGKPLCECEESEDVSRLP